MNEVQYADAIIALVRDRSKEEILVHLRDALERLYSEEDNLPRPISHYAHPVK